MFPLIALVLAAATPATDRVAADAVLTAYRAAWGRADAAGLAALFTPDAELVSAAATAEGRADIAKLYTAAFAGGMDATVLTTRLDGIRAVAPGVTFGRGTWRIAPRAGVTADPYCGRFFAVLRHERGAWRIAAFNEVQLACPTITP